MPRPFKVLSTASQTKNVVSYEVVHNPCYDIESLFVYIRVNRKGGKEVERKKTEWKTSRKKERKKMQKNERRGK